MPTGARDIRRDRRDRRRPESNLIPEAVYPLPVGADPGFDFSTPATFAYDAIIPSGSIANSLGFFIATGSPACIVFGSSGNLIVQLPGITPISRPVSSIFTPDYLDRRIRLAMTFNTSNPDFQFGLWADGDLLVRSGGTAPGGDWGDGGTVQIGPGLVIPSGSVLRYHQRIVEPFGSPRAPRFAQ